MRVSASDRVQNDRVWELHKDPASWCERTQVGCASDGSATLRGCAFAKALQKQMKVRWPTKLLRKSIAELAAKSFYKQLFM